MNNQQWVSDFTYGWREAFLYRLCVQVGPLENGGVLADILLDRNQPPVNLNDEKG